LISDIQERTIRQQAVEACIAGATLKQLKNIADQANFISVAEKRVERRGRQSTSINFGVTKNIHVAKIIVESILASKALTHLMLPIQEVDWKDHRAVSETFKQLLKALEKLHT
jgi:hypothetical protein